MYIMYRSSSSDAHIAATLVICASRHDAHVALAQSFQTEPSVLTIDCTADRDGYVMVAINLFLMTLRGLGVR